MNASMNASPTSQGRRRFAMAALTLVLALSPAAIVLAGEGIGGQDGASPAAVGPISATGKSVSQVKVVANDGLNGTSSQTLVDLPGASASITIPSAWGTGMIVARFSAQSEIEGSPTSTAEAGWVRIQIGGVDAAGGLRVFDDLEENGGCGGFSCARESNSMDAFRAGLVPGTYVVDVDFSVDAALAGFALGPWTLIVERIRQT